MEFGCGGGGGGEVVVGVNELEFWVGASTLACTCLRYEFKGVL